VAVVGSVAARRYATALLDVASEKGLGDKCLADLQAFARALSSAPPLREALLNPGIPRDAMARAIDAVAIRLGLAEASRAFLAVLGSHRRVGDLPGVVAAYADEQDRRAGRARGELVAAGMVQASQVLRLRDAVSKAIGLKLVLNQRQDPALLGGFQIAVGDRVFDMSVRTYLARLRSRLLENG
jgi:F-type H+-transporting ATPase subunit delta